MGAIFPLAPRVVIHPGLPVFPPGLRQGAMEGGTAGCVAWRMLGLWSGGLLARGRGAAADRLRLGPGFRFGIVHGGDGFCREARLGLGSRLAGAGQRQ
jgi:hypothetical protein